MIPGQLFGGGVGGHDGAECVSTHPQGRLVCTDGSTGRCKMHKMTCGLENVCGGDFLEQVGVDLGMVGSTERF